MANTTTGLFETLVAAATESAAAMSIKYRNAMVSKVFMGWQPVYGQAIGNTVNINIPTVNVGNVTDIGAGDIQIKDTDHSTVTVTLNKKASNPFIIRSFDQMKTPQDLRTLYLDARVEEVLQYVNRDICGLVTATNFNSYTTVTGGDDIFTTNHVATAWNNLAGGGAPVFDEGKVFLVTGNTPYSKMLTDPTWTQESIVGVRHAEASATARFLPRFGAEVDYDQHFPQPTAGSVYSGLYFHQYAIALRSVVEPPIGGPVMETVVYPRSNLAMKIQMWPSGDKQGNVVHVSACYGLAVVRPEFGSYMQTT